MVAGATHSRWSNRSRALSPSRTTAIPARGARRAARGAANRQPPIVRIAIAFPCPIQSPAGTAPTSQHRFESGSAGGSFNGLTSTAAWTNASISVSAPLCVTFSARAPEVPPSGFEPGRSLYEAPPDDGREIELPLSACG